MQSWASRQFVAATRQLKGRGGGEAALLVQSNNRAGFCSSWQRCGLHLSLARKIDATPSSGEMMTFFRTWNCKVRSLVRLPCSHSILKLRQEGDLDNSHLSRTLKKPYPPYFLCNSSKWRLFRELVLNRASVNFNFLLFFLLIYKF